MSDADGQTRTQPARQDERRRAPLSLSPSCVCVPAAVIVSLLPLSLSGPHASPGKRSSSTSFFGKLMDKHKSGGGDKKDSNADGQEQRARDGRRDEEQRGQ